MCGLTAGGQFPKVHSGKTESGASSLQNIQGMHFYSAVQDLCVLFEGGHHLFSAGSAQQH